MLLYLSQLCQVQPICPYNLGCKTQPIETIEYSLFDGSDIDVAVNVILGILRSVLWEAVLYKALLYSLFDGSGIVVVANVILCPVHLPGQNVFCLGQNQICPR